MHRIDNVIGKLFFLGLLETHIFISFKNNLLSNYKLERAMDLKRLKDMAKEQRILVKNRFHKLGCKKMGAKVRYLLRTW